MVSGDAKEAPGAVTSEKPDKQHHSSQSQDASRLYTDFSLSNKPGSIRVLDLDAGPKSSGSQADNAQLVGNFRVVSLNECPRFAALSYTWDNDSDNDLLKHTIVCSGHNLNITTNCRDALRDIRRQFGSVAIWVDAICINQNDIEERNSQIAFMKQIYSWAQPVYYGSDRGQKSPTEQSMSFRQLRA